MTCRMYHSPNRACAAVRTIVHVRVCASVYTPAHARANPNVRAKFHAHRALALSPAHALVREARRPGALGRGADAVAAGELRHAVELVGHDGGLLAVGVRHTRCGGRRDAGAACHLFDGMFDGMCDGMFDENGRWNVRLKQGSA